LPLHRLHGPAFTLTVDMVMLVPRRRVNFFDYGVAVALLTRGRAALTQASNAAISWRWPARPPRERRLVDDWMRGPSSREIFGSRCGRAP
jgi:hypothetical protein